MESRICNLINLIKDNKIVSIYIRTSSITTSNMSKHLRNYIDVYTRYNTFTEITNAIEGNTSIDAIAVDIQQITKTEIVNISSVIKVNNTITDFVLNNTSMGDDGAVIIAESLNCNKCIKQVCLTNNHIGDIGATAIAKTLQVNNTIKTIILAFNKITDSGAENIAKALQTNNTLNIIDLGYNKIEGSGAGAIAMALQRNSSVTTVTLGLKIKEFQAIIKSIAKETNANLSKNMFLYDETIVLMLCLKKSEIFISDAIAQQFISQIKKYKFYM